MFQKRDETPFIDCDKAEAAEAFRKWPWYIRDNDKDGFDRVLATAELTGWHATRVCDVRDIITQGILAQDPEFALDRMAKLSEHIGLAADEKGRVLQAAEKTLGGASNRVGVSFFSRRDLCRTYAKFAQYTGGETYRWALETCLGDNALSRLATVGRPIFIKFRYRFADLPLGLQETIGDLAYDSFQKGTPLWFDGYLAETIGPDRLLEIVPGAAVLGSASTSTQCLSYAVDEDNQTVCLTSTSVAATGASILAHTGVGVPEEGVLFALESRETALARRRIVYTIDVCDGKRKWQITDESGNLISKLTCTASSYLWGINVDGCQAQEWHSFKNPANLTVKANGGMFGVADVRWLRVLKEINALILNVGKASCSKTLLLDCHTCQVRHLSYQFNYPSDTFYRCGTEDWQHFVHELMDYDWKTHTLRYPVERPSNELYFSAVNELQELIVAEIICGYGEIERVDFDIVPDDTSKNYLLRVNEEGSQEALALLDFLTSPFRAGAWKGMYGRQPCIEMPSVYCLPIWRYVRFIDAGDNDEIGKAVWVNELARDDRVSGMLAPFQKMLHAYSDNMRELKEAVVRTIPTKFIDPRAYERLLKKRMDTERYEEEVRLRYDNLEAFQGNYIGTVRKLAMGNAVDERLRERILFYADIYEVYENAQFQPRPNGAERECADVWVPHKEVAIVYGCAETDEERAKYVDMQKKFAMRGIWLFEWDKADPRDKFSVEKRFRKERALRKKWLSEHKLNGRAEAATWVAGMLGGVFAG